MLRRLYKQIKASRSSKQTAPKRRKMQFETLEPRILLSADLGVERPEATAQEPAPTAIEQPLTPAQDSAVASVGANPAGDQAQVKRTEVIVVDASVNDYQSLINDLQQTSADSAHYEIHVLDDAQDGIEQISAILADQTDVAALHILAHGTDGQIHLGTSTLDQASLSEHSDALQGWGAALSESADIMLYGCDVAASQQGLDFLQSFSALTGADVAASDNATGTAQQGGDWVLEQSTGTIETTALSPDRYASLLTEVGSTSADETLTGTSHDDTYFFADDWGVDSLSDAGGTDTLNFSAVTDDLIVTFHADGTLSVTDGANALDKIGRASCRERV